MPDIIDKEGRLCHKILWACDIKAGRKDISEPREWLQLSQLNYSTGKKFKAHQHIWRSVPDYAIPQESWVIIKGEVQITLYDCEGNQLYKNILTQGDVSITYQGGHEYEIIADDTLVYEYKTGPYYGQDLDKSYDNYS